MENNNIDSRFYLNKGENNYMERIDGEKIIESLHVIQKVCNDNLEANEWGNCISTKCPFEVDGVCAITDLRPDDWKISEYKKFQALE